jgi:predicted  nucleic acid-binding Zn-ribbon protein
MAVIENLLNLFTVDKNVRGLRSRLDTAQRYFDAQTRQHAVLEQQRQELATRRKHLQATIANLEVEKKQLDARLEKLRNELNSSPNKKQYDALLSEMTTIKTAASNLEDRILAEMEQLENVEQQATALEPQLADRAKLRDLARTQLEERKSDVGHRLAELEVERQQAASVVPPQALAIFDSVADQYDGEVMSAVEVIDRKSREYACGACNMHIPFNQVSVLASANDAIVRCPSCTRILYMQDEMRGSLVKK